MATLINLQKRVANLIDHGLIWMGQSYDSLLEFYETRSKYWETKRPGCEPQPWGTHSNEDPRSFIETAAHILYGPHSAWPTVPYTMQQALSMAEYDCRLEEIETFAGMERLGIRQQFNIVRRDRSMESQFYFDKAVVYTKAVTENPALLDQHKAGWWCTAADLIAIGCSAKDLKKAVWLADRIGQADASQLAYFINQGQQVLCKAPLLNYNPHAVEAWKKGVKLPEYRLELFSRHLDKKSHWTSLKNGITENTFFEKLPEKHCVLLYAGVTPREISGNLLTEREAHDWLNKLANGNDLTAETYLRDLLKIPEGIFSRLRCHDRTLIEWLAAKWNTPAMTKNRTAHGPGGQSKSFTYLDIMDEIHPEDLGDNRNASVPKVFRAAAERLRLLYEARMGSNVKLPICPKKGTATIKQIITSEDMIAEGREMHHCVGGYVESCLRQISYIFRINDTHGRSTLEIGRASDKSWLLLQHHGVNDDPPPAEHIKIVQKWMEQQAEKGKQK